MTTLRRDFPEMPTIIVSQADQERLTRLALDALRRTPDVASELIAEMERAEVVPMAPACVVQMGSTVTFRSDDGREQRVTLVFPGQADIGRGRISILTPIGAALIGLSANQSIAWSTRNGSRRHLTVLAVEAGADTDGRDAGA